MARADAVVPRDVPTWRLYLLRAMYLLVVVGLGTLVWPQFFNRTLVFQAASNNTGATTGRQAVAGDHV
jgi:hypothetical protein